MYQRLLLDLFGVMLGVSPVQRYSKNWMIVSLGFPYEIYESQKKNTPRRAKLVVSGQSYGNIETNL